MTTLMMLLLHNNGLPMMPADEVAQIHFGLTTDKFVQKVRRGDIPLPLVEMEASQKAKKGVMLADLAGYIDERAAEARELARKMAS